MKYSRIYLSASIFSTLLLAFGCTKKTEQSLKIYSPDKNITLNFNLSEDGTPIYNVIFNNETIISDSKLGLSLAESKAFASGLKIVSFDTLNFSEVWHPKLGQFKNVINEYKQLDINLQSVVDKEKILKIIFRVFNEGIAFRYTVPTQNGLDSVNIMSENSNFNLTDNHIAWWNEAHYDSYEIMYNTTTVLEAKKLIETKQTKSEIAKELYMKNFGGTVAFNTPVTMLTQDSTYIAFHEANLTNYAEMTLAIEDSGNVRLRSELVPWPDGIKVKTKLPFSTPWRTIHITKNARDLMLSQMEENLNEPSKIEDESFITPIKYMGIWWGYHIGKFTWDPRGARGIADGKDPWFNKKPHGASTANSKEYIDFLSANKMSFMLIEGWNPTNYATDSVNNFLHSHLDFNLKEVVDYGRKKGVEIIIHNESMGQASNLELQADSAFARYHKLGIRALKVGWAWHLETKNFNRAWGTDSASVASYTGGKYFQHGQWAVQHYRKILEIAAKHKQMVALHEYVKETGIRRTYPNLMATEGVRGNEYNAWDKGKGNLPEHVTIIPFTRQLAGPIDYTPGIFDVLFDKYKLPQRVNSTLANQLALYVVFYSPMVMAADLPENYKGHPAFKFIQDVPADWDTAHVIHAKIGDYVTVARKNGNNWYIGSVTDENKRTINFTLDFLDANKNYTMIQYADAKDADWKTKPTAYEIIKSEVKKGDNVLLNLAAGGGQAIQIIIKQ